MSTPVDQLRLRILSNPREVHHARKTLESFAAQRGFSEKVVAEIGLCANEAIANIIRHAYDNVPDKPIDITVQYDGELLTIHFRDWGNGKLPDPDKLKEKLDQPGGLGLVCLRKMMDSIQFQPQSDGMLLTLTHRRG